MTHISFKHLPAPTLSRLPGYLHYLKKANDEGYASISCTHLAQIFRYDPTQIRKDLQAAGARGRAKIGYCTEELITVLEEFLGWNNVTDAFLAGAGNLGAALLGYSDFFEVGLNITAVFDKDRRKTGTKLFGRVVLDLYEMEDLIKRMHIRIGIIAVPAASAQSVAEIMVRSGVKGIWNFAPRELSVPETVVVENAQLSSSLSILKAKIKEKFL